MQSLLRKPWLQNEKIIAKHCCNQSFWELLLSLKANSWCPLRHSIEKREGGGEPRETEAECVCAVNTALGKEVTHIGMKMYFVKFQKQIHAMCVVFLALLFPSGLRKKVGWLCLAIFVRKWFTWMVDSTWNLNRFFLGELHFTKHFPKIYQSRESHIINSMYPSLTFNNGQYFDNMAKSSFHSISYFLERKKALLPILT